MHLSMQLFSFATDAKISTVIFSLQSVAGSSRLVETVVQVLAALVQLPGLQPCLCRQNTMAAAHRPFGRAVNPAVVQPPASKTK